MGGADIQCRRILSRKDDKKYSQCGKGKSKKTKRSVGVLKDRCRKGAAADVCGYQALVQVNVLVLKCTISCIFARVSNFRSTCNFTHTRTTCTRIFYEYILQYNKKVSVVVSLCGV